jgi:hypothetical protein
MKKSLNWSISFILIFSSLLVNACTNKPDIANSDSNSARTNCTEPRPQICTNEYLPVCGTAKDGGTKTYATGCTACANKNVMSYIKDACKSPS